MSRHPPMEAHQWGLLQALIGAHDKLLDSNSPERGDGSGGELFTYNEMAEGQFVHHPGFSTPQEVLTDQDIHALLDREYLVIREHEGKSLRFAITEAGFRAAREIPEA